MIENKEAAKAISELMLEFGARLDESLLLVQRQATEAEFARYKKVVASLMGDMLLEVMNPLYVRHPDLKPSELD